PDSNLRQAHVIDSATVLPNPIGTAPGWLVRAELHGKERVIVTLPGPPREPDRMWQEEAKPRLELPASRLFVRTFKTLGAGESHIAELLGDLTRQANPSVATYAKLDGVHVRVAAKAEDAASAEELAQPTLERVKELIGEQTWGYDADELPRLVLDGLERRGARQAVADGRLAHQHAQGTGPRAKQRRWQGDSRRLRGSMGAGTYANARCPRLPARAAARRGCRRRGGVGRGDPCVLHSRLGRRHRPQPS